MEKINPILSLFVPGTKKAGSPKKIIVLIQEDGRPGGTRTPNQSGLVLLFSFSVLQEYLEKRPLTNVMQGV